MPESTTPIAAFETITFSYKNGAEPVIKNFSATIRRGSKVGIKADSGTGKTTLLRLILGFERPNTGTIFFESQPIADDNFQTVRSSTAWLPQDLNIGDGTVLEVLERPFEFRRNQQDRPEKPAMVEALTILGLPPEITDKQFRDLSTGQRQRVGLALCHLLDRPMLLLDEPTSALDKSSKQKAADLLLEDAERTVISTTHDPFWLERCDRIIEL